VELVNRFNDRQNRLIGAPPPADIFAGVCFLPPGSAVVPPDESWPFDSWYEASSLENYVRGGILQTAWWDILTQVLADLKPPSTHSKPVLDSEQQLRRRQHAARLREALSLAPGTGIHTLLVAGEWSDNFAQFLWRCTALWGAAEALTANYRQIRFARPFPVPNLPAELGDIALKMLNRSGPPPADIPAVGVFAPAGLLALMKLSAKGGGFAWLPWVPHAGFSTFETLLAFLMAQCRKEWASAGDPGVPLADGWHPQILFRSFLLSLAAAPAVAAPFSRGGGSTLSEFHLSHSDYNAVREFFKLILTQTCGTRPKEGLVIGAALRLIDDCSKAVVLEAPPFLRTCLFCSVLWRAW